MLAVWAAVVEELDNCHIAPRVAPHRRRRVIENLAPPVAQNCFRFGICLAVQLIFGAVQRLDQNVGIVEKVVVNDSLDGLALLSWNFGSSHWSGMQSDNKTVDQSEGHKWRAIRHHVKYSRKKKLEWDWVRSTRVHDAARQLVHVLRLAMDVFSAIVACGVFWQ